MALQNEGSGKVKACSTWHNVHRAKQMTCMLVIPGLNTSIDREDTLFNSCKKESSYTDFSIYRTMIHFSYSEGSRRHCAPDLLIQTIASMNRLHSASRPT